MRRDFDLWYDFYKKSGTTMEFKVFSDCASPWTHIGNFPITRLTACPPCSSNELAYGDWLRSELYKTVQKPIIYMDLDCLILKPIDESYFNFDKDLAMTYVLPRNAMKFKSDINNHMSCGLVVFKKDFSAIYQERFRKNPNKYDRNNMLYGEFIWSDLNKELGYAMPIEYHYCWNILTETNDFLSKIKVIHMHRKMGPLFVKVAKILQNSQGWRKDLKNYF